MQLVKMNFEQYQIWFTRSKEEYIKTKMESNGYTRLEAEQIASDSYAKLLPLGHVSVDQFLYSIYHEEFNDKIIGYLWFYFKTNGQSKKAFIYDIIIEEEYRGKGYGRLAMLACEIEAKKLGAMNLGLHVFANNAAAIALYQSLGYVTTDFSMEKNIV